MAAVLSMFATATSTDKITRCAKTAVLPVGSFEQHGDHLPLMTDTLIACEIAGRLAENYELLLLPPVTISCSHEHAGFPGTVSIKATTLVAFVDDVVDSLNISGITHVVLVNGHGGNHVLANLVCAHNIASRTMMLFPSQEDWCTARTHAGMETTNHDDMHGGELETSLLLHTHPRLVGDNYTVADHEVGDRPDLLITGMAGYTSSGIIGRPSVATAAKGRIALDSLSESFADRFKTLTS
ncbi:creatininase family protein [Nocardia brasiliensis]|uniref:creatininase family protein n=1 Tax=Nocardia brasiliensis TaxID=37326 RepID=UPI003D919BA2